MKIALVTNRSLKRSYENLILANRKLVEENNILITENTALAELNHNQKEAIKELLKEKEILADKIAFINCKNINNELRRKSNRGDL